MVTWDTSQTVELDSHDVDGPGDAVLINEISKLRAGGGTDLHAGLAKGYALAEKNFMPGGMNRVVLISDGGANAGITDKNIIAEAASNQEDQAIYLVGVGVSGGGGYNDDLMDTVTDWGKGASIYIDSENEAYKMFGQRFLSSMEIAALDVRVELTLPPFFDIDKFFGEEYSSEPSEVEPQHLAPNDTMIYQQLIKTTQPEMVRGDDKIDLKVTYTDVATGEPGEISTSSTLQELVDAPCPELRKGDSIVVYAQTLGFVDLLLEESEYERAFEECQNGLEIIEKSAAALDDDDLEEISKLLQIYCARLAN
jgi:hypothetical protein